MLETTGRRAEAAQGSPRREITSEFFETVEASPEGAIPRPIPTPVPLPLFLGSRFMVWKQDPSVQELGYRLSFIPGLVLDGPRDARISSSLSGVTPIVRNATGDFIFRSGSPESDCAHTYAVVRQTLTLYERERGGKAIPWAWNRNGNTDPLTVFPHGFAGANAFYSRTQKALRFGRFTPSGSQTEVFTCRSLDIVSHECGHAVLDGLKPGWLGTSNPPQTGGLHEAFGDLSAIFLALSQLDQVEAFITMTKADLHKKNFLSAMAEEFGAAIGRNMGLRNADNDLKLSEVGNEVHAISQVFTGGIYDVLADIFAFEKNRQRFTKDAAQVLLEVGQHLRNLVLNAFVQAPDVAATYADVVNKILVLSHAQGDPPIYRTFIRNRFALREVVVSATPVNAMVSGTMDIMDANFTGGTDVLNVAAAHTDHPSLVASQDRSGCCGTMQLPEYAQPEHRLNDGLRRLIAGEALGDSYLLGDEISRLHAEFS